MYGAMAGGARGMDIIANPEDHGGCRYRLIAPMQFGSAAFKSRSDFITHDVERMKFGKGSLTDQQFERALGRFKIVALVLHLLHPLQDLPARGIVQMFFQAVLLQFVINVAPAGEITQQDALYISNRLWIDVLVAGGIL